MALQVPLGTKTKGCNKSLAVWVLLAVLGTKPEEGKQALLALLVILALQALLGTKPVEGKQCQALQALQALLALPALLALLVLKLPLM